MKPITFENLRRLIGGRRKNKDRNESPFKRSESFKRISIRKNYLESRGGAGGGQKGRNPTKRPPSIDNERPQSPPPRDDHRPQSPPQRDDHRPQLPPPRDDQRPQPPPPRDDQRPQQPPPKDDQRSQPPPPPPFNVGGKGGRPVSPLVVVVPSPRKDVVATSQLRKDVVATSQLRKDDHVAVVVPSDKDLDATIAAPVIDYGEWIRCIRAEEDLNHIKRSRSPPTPPARYRYHVHKELDDSSRTDSAISLGRIWMDAPMLPPAAPRSLELPARPAAASASAAANADGLKQRRAHHSLESALKDKRDDRPVPRGRFFHRYPVVDKTASRSSVASTCSGKDSGFSLSAPGLSDPPRPSKQLFRKKVPRRPAAAARGAGITPSPTPPDQLYQVVVARSPLRQLKLDPMMFVPPEKRRAANHQGQQQKSRTVVEVRDYCVPKDARAELRGDGTDDYDYDTEDDDEQDRLYESISRGCVRSRWQESTDDADTEDDVHHQRRQHQNQYHGNHHQHHHGRRTTAVAAAGSRVKRKKSARRNIKYVVKPVRRAPSVVARKPSVAAKSKSAWIATSTSPKIPRVPRRKCV